MSHAFSIVFLCFLGKQMENGRNSEELTWNWSTQNPNKISIKVKTKPRKTYQTARRITQPPLNPVAKINKKNQNQNQRNSSKRSQSRPNPQRPTKSKPQFPQKHSLSTQKNNKTMCETRSAHPTPNDQKKTPRNQKQNREKRSTLERGGAKIA